MNTIIDIKYDITSNNVLEVISLTHYKPTKEKMQLLTDSYLKNKDIKVFGYKIDANITGVIVINNHDNNTIIESISVAIQYRKMGIGKKLIHYVVDTLDINIIEAETDDDAVGFYRNCGFCIEDLGFKYKNVRRYRCRLTVK